MALNKNSYAKGGSTYSNEGEIVVRGKDGETKSISTPKGAYDFEIGGDDDTWVTYLNPNKKDEDGYDYIEIVPMDFKIQSIEKAGLPYKKGGSTYSNGKGVYPFNEGDDYWTIEDGDVVRSCWDFVSEELYDENPNKKLFKTEQEAIDSLKNNK